MVEKRLEMYRFTRRHGTVIEDNYIENPEFALKCMNKVIKAAIKNDLYIIIDWHTYYPQKKEAKAFSQ